MPPLAGWTLFLMPAVMQAPVQCPALPFISQMEAKLRGISGLDAVLASLIAHAQQNAASGSKLGPGALVPAASKQDVQEVPCLSAVQEQHSSARALPLLIRLYFNTGSRAEVGVSCWLAGRAGGRALLLLCSAGCVST